MNRSRSSRAALSSGDGHPDCRGDIMSPGTSPHLLATTVHQWLEGNPLSHVEHPDPLGATELVPERVSMSTPRVSTSMSSPTKAWAASVWNRVICADPLHRLRDGGHVLDTPVSLLTSITETTAVSSVISPAKGIRIDPSLRNRHRQ
jgi:hypothetical protein